MLSERCFRTQWLYYTVFLIFMNIMSMRLSVSHIYSNVCHMSHTTHQYITNTNKGLRLTKLSIDEVSPTHVRVAQALNKQCAE